MTECLVCGGHNECTEDCECENCITERAIALDEARQDTYDY